jgi:hypothetical protein
MDGKLRRGVIAALIGLAVGLGVQGVSATLLSAPTRTFTLVGKEREFQVVDLTPPGVSHGDLRVFNGPLYQADATTVIGRADGVCTVTDPAEQAEGHIAQCVLTYSLPDGEITAQGVTRRPTLPALPTPPARLAITGGTEQYQTARGQIQLETRGERLIVTFQLTRAP